MAKRINLREYQENVFARLRNVAGGSASSLAKLGVLIGDQPCLVDMRDVSEVVPVTRTTEVPMVKSWFCGVANVRGNLYSVTDLQEFLGQGKTAQNAANRLLLLHPRLIHNSAFLVSGMLGLRYLEQMQQLSAGGNEAQPWVLGEYRGQDGRTWREINVGALIQHPEYLKVGVADI